MKRKKLYSQWEFDCCCMHFLPRASICILKPVHMAGSFLPPSLCQCPPLTKRKERPMWTLIFPFLHCITLHTAWKVSELFMTK